MNFGTLYAKLLLAVAAAALAVAPAARACAPQNDTTPTELAPHLYLLKAQTGRGNCPLGIRIAAKSSDGTLWAVDYNRNLWRSVDSATSWNVVAQLPSGWRGFTQVLPLASGALLVEASDGSGNRHLFRSAGSAASPAFDFSAPNFVLPSGSYVRSNQDWLELDGAVLIGEYGTAPNPVNLWRSADDGRTFTSAASWPGGNGGVRHVHGLFADPYVPHRLWITIGDTGAQPRIGYSDDGGSTFSWIVQGGYPASPRARAVGLLFTPSAVYWGTDSPEIAAGFYRWDRATGAVTTILTGLNGPFYMGESTGGLLAQFSEVSTRSNDGYIGDEFLHVITSSTDGRDAVATTLPWRRTSGDSNQKAFLYALTKPDDSGRVWASLMGIDGSEGNVVNVQMQLADSPAPEAQPSPAGSGVADPGQQLGGPSPGGASGGGPTQTGGGGTPGAVFRGVKIARAVLRNNVLTVRLICPASAARTCSGSARATFPGVAKVSTSTASVNVRAGASTTAHLRLSAAAVRAARKAGRARIRVVAVDASGKSTTSQATLVLAH